MDLAADTPPTSKLITAVHRAYLTALLLTGDTEQAEAAVIDAITLLEIDSHFQELLILETIKKSIGPGSEPPGQQLQRVLAILPFELRSVLLLSPTSRQCFVMRVLAGLAPDVCSDLLNLDSTVVEESTLAAMKQLPLVQHPGARQASKAHLS